MTRKSNRKKPTPNSAEQAPIEKHEQKNQSTPISPKHTVSTLQCSESKEILSNLQLELKVVLVGASNVGKSSILQRFVRSTFRETIPPTAAAAYMAKEAMLNDAQVKFCLWDTAGQELFRSVVPMYYRNANAVLIVADLQRPQTVNGEIPYWIDQVKTHCGLDSVEIFFAGNKLDTLTATEQDGAHDTSTEQPATVAQELQRVATNFRNNFSDEDLPRVFLVSAKTGEGVFEMFEAIGRRCIEMHKRMLIGKVTSPYQSHEETTPQQSRECTEKHSDTQFITQVEKPTRSHERAMGIPPNENHGSFRITLEEEFSHEVSCRRWCC